MAEIVEKLREALVHLHHHVGPVVQPRTFQLLIVDGEPEGAHEVEAGTGGSTGAGDGADVAGNLWQAGEKNRERGNYVQGKRNRGDGGEQNRKADTEVSGARSRV